MLFRYATQTLPDASGATVRWRVPAHRRPHACAVTSRARRSAKSASREYRKCKRPFRAVWWAEDGRAGAGSGVESDVRALDFGISGPRIGTVDGQRLLPRVALFEVAGNGADGDGFLDADDAPYGVATVDAGADVDGEDTLDVAPGGRGHDLPAPAGAMRRVMSVSGGWAGRRIHGGVWRPSVGKARTWSPGPDARFPQELFVSWLLSSR